MTSSGTYNFSVSDGDAVIGAYERIGIRLPSLRQEHYITARRELNLLFVAFNNAQVNLWKVVLNTISLVAGTATYSIPANTILILDGYITTNPGSQYGQNNRYITQLSRTDYASLSNPNTPGPPTQFWYFRGITQSVTFWPVPDNNGPYTFGYYSALQIQDANLPNGETPDVPLRWYDAMVAGLAYRLARVYAPTLEAQRKMDAKEAWDMAAAQDTENVNLSIGVPLRRYYPR
jgi:hypothetical protein